MSRVIKLHPADNVLVAMSPVVQGDMLIGEGYDGTLVARDNVAMAHKLAARAIAKGETVVKYGMPIGEASDDIARGAHVHVHNVASLYTPTHYNAERSGLESGDSDG